MAAIGGNLGTAQTSGVGATTTPKGHISAQDFASNSALVALGKQYGDTPAQISDCLSKQENFDAGNNSFPAGKRQEENVGECLNPESRKLMEAQKHYAKPSALSQLGAQLGQTWAHLTGKPTDGL